MADKVRVPAETDHGSVLSPNAAAVVYDPDNQDAHWHLLIPDWGKHEDDEPVPPEIVMLSAFFARIHRDQEFVNDLVQWMQDQKDN
jgi:hypothetical protein